MRTMPNGYFVFNCIHGLDGECFNDEPNRDREEHGQQDVETERPLDAVLAVLSAFAIIGDGFVKERC